MLSVCASTQAKGLGGLSTPLTVTGGCPKPEMRKVSWRVLRLEMFLKGVSPCQGIIRFRSNKRKEILWSGRQNLYCLVRNFSTKHGNNSESFRTIWNHLDACWSNTSRRGANFIIFYPRFASCDLASEGHYKGDQRAEWGPSLCFSFNIIAWLWIVAVGWLCSAQETKKLLRLMGVPVVWHLWVVICFMSWHGIWHNVALLRWRLQVKLRRSALSTVFCAYDSVRSIPENFHGSISKAWFSSHSSPFSVSKLVLVKDVLRSIVNLDVKHKVKKNQEIVRHCRVKLLIPVAKRCSQR